VAESGITLLETFVLDPRQGPREGREFDPVRVGFRSVPEEGGVRSFEFDTTLPGSSNAGHAFGTLLGDEEKTQLIEYLKSP
jgi:hypothetical protein